MKVVYDQERVDLLRTVRDALKAEINDEKKSRYYIGRSGKYVDLRDFDHARLRSDYATAYPQIAAPDLEWIINFSIYIWYLR